MREDDAMFDLRSSLFESLNRLRPELSPSAEAQLTIPMGTVQHTRQVFEARIRQHRHERDSIFLARALHNTDELIRQELTYAQQLHLAEIIGLRSLPPRLLDFIRDHDNLYRAAIRSRAFASLIATKVDVDIFTRVASQILNLRNVYALNLIRETRSPAERLRMLQDPTFMKELVECTDALVDEVFRILHRFQALTVSLQGDVDLENVGPDHNVNDFGSEFMPHSSVNDSKAAPNNGLQTIETDKLDHTQRCCICLDPYTPAHPSFQLSSCHHVIGKPCLTTWLNSVAKNANCCPFCRTELCTRRARQPSSRAVALVQEQDQLCDRLYRALDLLEDADRLHNQIFGTGEEVTDGKWLADAMTEINRRCFENGVDFGFMRDGMEVYGWRLRRLDWARGLLIA